MAPTKKVYFGSLFEFAKTGAEEILEGFRDQFTDPEDVPFVSYNKPSQVCVPLFSADIEVNDNTVIPLINAQIGAYITLNNKTNDPLDSDRLVSIGGTTLHHETRDITIRELEPHTLFEIEESSDDDQLESTDNAVYWKPECGDITILSSDVAAEIADATGTFLMPDFPGRRIQLAHGNLQLALEKLTRLENIMTLIAPHRSNATSRTNGNAIFVLGGPEATIKFVRPIQPLPGFNRIVLSPTQTPIFNQILLSEVRVWEQTQRIKPVNLDLDGVSLTSHIGSCELFDRTSLPTLGSVKNAEPKIPSTDQSQISGEIQRPTSPTKFLGQKDTDRVEEWRGNIDPDAAPPILPVEPITEVDQKRGRRRVAQESDDEEDQEQKPATNSIPQPSPVEAGSVPIPVPARAPGSNTTTRPSTSRRVAVKEDTSSDDEESAIKHNSKINYLPHRVIPGKTKSSISKGKLRSTGVPQQRTNNMFELIGPSNYSEDDGDRSKQTFSLGEPSSEQSSIKQKHLEVKFEEAQSATQIEDTQDSSKSFLSREFETPTAPSFNSSNYSARKEVPRSRPTPSQNQSSFSHDRSNGMSSNPVQAMSRPVNEGSLPRTWSQNNGNYRLRGALCGSGRGPAHGRQQNLIDISDEPTGDEPIMPPPGFDYRSVSSGLADTLMSSHVETVQNSIIRQPITVDAASSILQSTPGLISYDDRSFEFTPQLTVPKRNINFLQGQAAARLKAKMSSGTAKIDQTSGDLPPNRILIDDEPSTRKYHNTMNQKMAKPGKGKGSGNNRQETKAQKDARIAKAKAEAYGEASDNKNTSKPPTKPDSKNQPPLEAMSAKKRQLLKENQNLADMHPEAHSDDAVRDSTSSIMTDLNPILKATLAFKGLIKVEFQLGQALVLQNSRLDESRLYTIKDWQLLLNNKAGNSPKAIFTNILTTNGKDIDRMLEVKSDAEFCKVWDKDQPGFAYIKFEFTCQDKSGREFVLVLDEDGSHHLAKSSVTIGQVALHAPGQIWDACAVVEGTMKLLRPSEDVLLGVEQFKDSIYMPGGKKVAIYYRLPANNAFTIRSIVVKRLSVHNCLLKNHDNIQLRVTESKALAHSSNPSDKKLFRSFESNYTVMVNEGRMHYEVAIADTAIEDMFKGNPEILIGEPATVPTLSGTILTHIQLRKLVEVTTYMLERIDWAGANNAGTLQRIFENAAGQRASIINAFPPNLNSNLPIPMGTTAPLTVAPATYQSVRSHIGGAGTGNVVAEPVLRQLQGIRMNTVAELYQDRSTGDFFYYGAGGARIPVVKDEMEGLKFDNMGTIRPIDSASQVGDNKRKMPLSSNKAKAGVLAEEKPPGFW